jgi:hypothetical protein
MIAQPLLGKTLTAEFTVHLVSYIGHPYWPEMAQLVDITKQSGMNRARSSANVRKALEEYLQAQGMTLADYERIKAAAELPFYTVDGPGTAIIVPELHVTSMLVQTCDTIRSAGRPCPPDQVRSVMRCAPWVTKHTAPDGVWERFAVVSSGTGAKLSNQRGFRTNPYIENAKAAGAIELLPEMVRPEVLQKALTWAGERIGIGACRKMGWGRFRISDWQVK